MIYPTLPVPLPLILTPLINPTPLTLLMTYPIMPPLPLHILSLP